MLSIQLGVGPEAEDPKATHWGWRIGCCVQRPLLQSRGADPVQWQSEPSVPPILARTLTVEGGHKGPASGRMQRRHCSCNCYRCLQPF